MSQNKRILLTGASGFLGTVMKDELGKDNFSIVTLGRSHENNIICELSSNIPEITQPVHWVIHNAGKAHVVPRSVEETAAFYDVNVKGTGNLLAGIEKSGSAPEAFAFISSIAVYGLTKGEAITETHPLNATDPYGKSKIESEKLVATWCSNHGIPLLILRLPLIAGKNPPGNLQAMIHGIKRGYYAGIGDSNARKSIVMAEDVAKSIPALIQHPGIYHLTDGYHPSFRELELLIAGQIGCKPPHHIPLWLALALGMAGDIIDKVLPGKLPITSAKIEKITSTLTFDDQKVRKILTWRPQKVLDAFRIS